MKRKVTAYQIINPRGGVCTIRLRFSDGSEGKVTYNENHLTHFIAASVMLQSRNVFYYEQHKAFVSQENSNEYTFESEL